MTKYFIGVALAAATLTTAGCEDKKQQPPLTTPQQAPGPVATPKAAETPKAQPVPAPPPTKSDATSPASANSNFSGLGVSLTFPANWSAKPPSNQMRLAEADVPDAGGDPAKLCLVVLSTAGGTVADNIARWSGQVRDVQGQPAPSKPETRVVNGFNVTVVEMSGSFAGMGDSAPRDNWMLRGAIIEAPEGLLFIKMTGPAASMTTAAPSFESFVGSVKKL